MQKQALHLLAFTMKATN